MKKDSILVIDDNHKICSLIKKYGEKKFGYDIEVAYTIDSAIEELKSNIYDLITLDIELENENGLEAIEEIKKYFTGPVLFVSCLDDIKSILSGFDKGADDYITKPFNIDELFYRIKRSIERTKKTSLLTIENYKIDNIKNEVYMDDRKLELNEYSAKILIFLLQNKGEPQSRNDIFNSVWESNYTFSTRVIDTYISLIRKETNDPRIRSVRNTGYVFEL